MFLFAFQLIFVVSDTDSYYILFTGWSYDMVLNKLSFKIDFSNFPENHPRFSKERKAQFGYVKVDTAERVIHAFTGERKKSYQLFMSNSSKTVDLAGLSRKTVKKGCPETQAKNLSDKEIVGLLKEPTVLKTSFNKLQTKNHIIKMINQKKQVSSSFDDSAFYLSCGLCNIPFHSTLDKNEKCNSVNCDRNRILTNIWIRVLEQFQQS